MNNEKNMNMEAMDNSFDELEHLKEQLGVFKECLDRQKIISDRMLRDSMHSKIMWIRNMNLYVSIAGVVLLPIFVCVLRFYELSWLACAVPCVMMVCEAVVNFRNVRGMNRLADGDLFETARRMLRFKRSEQIQMAIEVPLLFAWLVWVSFEMNTSFVVPLFFGMIVGLVIAFMQFFKEMKDINKIVRQIDDYLKL